MWGDACYLTVSMCPCDGQLGRGGARASTLDTLEELKGGAIFSTGSGGVTNPQNEQARLRLSISPGQALGWQVRLYIAVPLHKTESQNSGALRGKDVGQVTDWPLWILFLIVTAALGHEEPSGTKACARRRSFRKAVCL